MKKQLNINPSMDKMACDNGLGHWSCVAPLGAIMWVRSDGCTYDYQSGRFSSFIDGCADTIISTPYVILALKECDVFLPIGKDWQHPETDLPIKTEPEPVWKLNHSENKILMEIDFNGTTENSVHANRGLTRSLCNGDLYKLIRHNTWNDSPAFVDQVADLPEQPTLVQKPFQYPCDGALYFTKTCKHQAIISGFFGSDNKKIIGIVDGIRNNYFWCSETGKAVSPFGDTAISNDLIMFCWE